MRFLVAVLTLLGGCALHLHVELIGVAERRFLSQRLWQGKNAGLLSRKHDHFTPARRMRRDVRALTARTQGLDRFEFRVVGSGLRASAFSASVCSRVSGIGFRASVATFGFGFSSAGGGLGEAG